MNLWLPWYMYCINSFPNTEFVPHQVWINNSFLPKIWYIPYTCYNLEWPNFCPRPVLASGYRHYLRLSVCLSLHVSTILFFLITHHSFKLGSQHLDQGIHVHNTLVKHVKIPIVLGEWLTLTFKAKFNFKNQNLIVPGLTTRDTQPDQ